MKYNKKRVIIAIFCMSIGSNTIFAGNLPGMPDWNNFNPGVSGNVSPGAPGSGNVSPGLPMERRCQPIHDAAKALDLAKVQQLVSQGVNINTKGCFFVLTPLQLAIMLQDDKPKNPAAVETMVRWLLDHGAATEINYQYPEFLKTALICAVKSNFPRVVQMLLDKGADPNLVMADGSSALMIAANDGLTECARVLINNPKTNLRQKMRDDTVSAAEDPKREPIHIAAFFNRIPILELLVQKGVSVNEKDDFGNTPLHYAARRLSHEAIQFLISKGADKSIKNKDGISALGEAATVIKAQNPKLKEADIRANPTVQLLVY